jgi:hypothetical protein
MLAQSFSAKEQNCDAKPIKASSTVCFRGSPLRNAICFVLLVLQLVIIMSDLSENLNG